MIERMGASSDSHTNISIIYYVLSIIWDGFFGFVEVDFLRGHLQLNEGFVRLFLRFQSG